MGGYKSSSVNGGYGNILIAERDVNGLCACGQWCFTCERLSNGAARKIHLSSVGIPFDRVPVFCSALVTVSCFVLR